MLEPLWGGLTAIIGLAIFTGAVTRSRFLPYRLLEARARLLWKEDAHTFLMVVGAILVAVGIAWASGFLWS